MEGSILLAQFVGLDARDPQWIDSDGRNCTRMCNFSTVGGFSSNEWTLKGWILDDYSMDILREEFRIIFPRPIVPRRRRYVQPQLTAAAESQLTACSSPASLVYIMFFIEAFSVGSLSMIMFR